MCIVGAYPAFPSAAPRFDTLESAPPDDCLPPVLGFRVYQQGLGFRVWGLGFRVWGLGFRV